MCLAERRIKQIQYNGGEQLQVSVSSTYCNTEKLLFMFYKSIMTDRGLTVTFISPPLVFSVITNNFSIFDQKQNKNILSCIKLHPTWLFLELLERQILKYLLISCNNPFYWNVKVMCTFEENKGFIRKFRHKVIIFLKNRDKFWPGRDFLQDWEW